MTSQYQRLLFAELVILELVVSQPVGLLEFVGRLEERCAVLREREADFELSFWAGGSLMEILTRLKRCRLLASSGELTSLSSAVELSGADATKSYIEAALESVGSLAELAQPTELARV